MLSDSAIVTVVIVYLVPVITGISELNHQKLGFKDEDSEHRGVK